jgi:hypothetical protein
MRCWRAREREPETASVHSTCGHSTSSMASNAGTGFEDGSRVLPEHLIATVQLPGQRKSKSPCISACTFRSAPWLQHKRRWTNLCNRDKRWALDSNMRVLLISSPLRQVNATVLCKHWESSSLRARHAEQAAFCARIPLLLDMDKTTYNERLEGVLNDRFVPVQLSMGSKTPHNKGKVSTSEPSPLE